MRAKKSWLTIGVACCAERDHVRVEKDGNGMSCLVLCHSLPCPVFSCLVLSCLVCALLHQPNPTQPNTTTNTSPDTTICYEQPRPVPVSPTNPHAPRPKATPQIYQRVSSTREYAARASSMASLNVLTRPRRSHSRPTIGHPTDFRHTDGFDGIQSMVDDAPLPVRCRPSYRPLQLSIYLPDGRLSPLPDFDSEDSWGTRPANIEMPAQALVRGRHARLDSVSSTTSTFLIQRKPVGSGSRRSSLQSQASVDNHRLDDAAISPTHPRPSPLPISGQGLRRAHTSGTSSPGRPLSRLPSPSRSRANTAPSRPASLRRTKTDVDDAIRELNTIVEERRASTYRSQSPWAHTGPPPSPSHHVPHFAPTMRMHVRSETLSDIGSAFSVPLSKALPSAPAPAPAKPQREFTGPLTSNPISPRPQPPTTPIHRLGAWLKRSTTSSTISSTISTPRPFYNLDNTPALPFDTTHSPVPTHSRQTSADTTGSTASSLASHSSSRTPSRTSSISTAPTVRRPLTGAGTKRRPAPLVLDLDQKQAVVVPGRVRELQKRARNDSRTPPESPNYRILPGREMCGRDVGVGIRLVGTPVGVAF